MAFFNAIIIACYFIFAFQMWMQIKRPVTGRGALAIVALVVVFMLCAVAGYMTDILTFPFQLNLWLHILLAAASVWLVVTNQAKFIAALMQHESD